MLSLTLAAVAFAALAPVAAAIDPSMSQCRFRAVKLNMYDDGDVNLYNMMVTFREQVKATDQPGVVSWIKVEDGQGVNCIAYGSDGAEVALRGIHDTVGDVDPPQPILNVSCTECPDDFGAAPPPPPGPTDTPPAPAPTLSPPAPPAPAPPAPPAPTTTSPTGEAPPDVLQATQSTTSLGVTTMTAVPGGAGRAVGAGVGGVGGAWLVGGAAALGAWLVMG